MLKPNHFYWNGKLHLLLFTNRPANLVDAWNYSERKRVSILYADYRSNSKPAVQMGVAAKIMNLSARSLREYIAREVIRPPEKSYTLDGEFSAGRWWWGEHNLMELHDFLLTVHHGHVRRDGRITPSQKLPSKAQIRAAFNNNTILYVKGKSGEFVPLFEQPRW